MGAVCVDVSDLCPLPCAIAIGIAIAIALALALALAVVAASCVGPINSWDRIPYLVEYDGVGPTLTPQTNVITRNLLFNNYNSVWPIDHDDGSAYYEDSYNGQSVSQSVGRAQRRGGWRVVGGGWRVAGGECWECWECWE